MDENKGYYCDSITTKTKTVVVGNSLYMLISKNVRDAMGIELKNGHIYHCNLIKYQPVKMRILKSYMEQHKIIEIETWSGRTQKGYVIGVDQSDVELTLENLEDPEKSTYNMTAMPLIKTIIVDGHRMEFNKGDGDVSDI